MSEADKQILEKFKNTKESVSNQIDAFEFGQALHDLYEFFWKDFCDVYLEASKQQLTTDNQKQTTQQILFYVLASSIKLLHPFMPFITEEIWQNLPAHHSFSEGGTVENKKALIVENWQ